MKLWEYVGKKVRVYFKDGDIYDGIVIDFDHDYDTYNGQNAILLRTDDSMFSIDENEIESIKVIESEE
ncbi:MULTISPECIES: hypothetical protein [Staphylococcus]|uniref:LSM domain protein n=1 Tax=Staphylococcus hsinchuensis TaxID=3051183 RepID=A0ABZ3ECF3_9STAP|nr:MULTISPECIES: hypothetical protein [unclassified Staphylococcus]